MTQTKASKMNHVVALAPTFARYALLILGTKLTEGGWLPAGVADELVADPAIIEMFAGLGIAAVGLVWFLFSTAKKAIQNAGDS